VNRVLVRFLYTLFGTQRPISLVYMSQLLFRLHASRIQSITVMFVLLSAFGSVVAAQSVPDVLKRMELLISTEDVPSIVAMASDPLDIAAFGATRTYSRTQGIYVLRDIFKSVDVRSFSIADHTESLNGLFVEGIVEESSSAQPIRIYVRLKRSFNEWSIRELLFERLDK